jgi:hypothetical protein
MRKVAMIFGLYLAGACSVRPASAEDTGLSPTTDRYLQRIFRGGLISTYFDRDLRRVAEQFTRRTRFAGNIRINEAANSQALNIYVFHYSEDLPLFLRNNCNTFPADNVILCDHALLDSMPTTPPVQLSNDQKGLPPPALMFWVIGHEIGHVVLG